MAKAKNIAATPENAKAALAEVEAAARFMPRAKHEHAFMVDIGSGNIEVFADVIRVMRVVAEQSGRGKPYIALKFKRHGQLYSYVPTSLADLRDMVQMHLADIAALNGSPMMIRQDIELRAAR